MISDTWRVFINGPIPLLHFDSFHFSFKRMQLFYMSFSLLWDSVSKKFSVSDETNYSLSKLHFSMASPLSWFFPLKRETDNNIVENEIEFDWSNVAKMTHPSSSTVAFNKSCPLLKTGYFLFHHPVYIAIKGSKRNKFFDIFLLLYLFYSILFYSPLFYFFSFFNLVSAYLEFLLFLFNITIFSIFLQLPFHFSFILSTFSFIFVCHKFFHLLWH